MFRLNPGDFMGKSFTVNEFRQALPADAARLEVNSQGTGLNQKGVSDVGRAVEWIRDAAGLRTSENRQVMGAFVHALRKEYDPTIAAQVEGRLQQAVGDGKPLSARVVKQVLSEADALRINMQRNQRLIDNLTHVDARGKVTGYLVAGVKIGQELGVPDEIGNRLFDEASPLVLELRQRISDGIKNLAGNPPQRVSHDAARGVAEQEIRQFLITAANSNALEKVIGAGAPNSPFQQRVATLANEMGLPQVAGLLSDPNSETSIGFRRFASYGLPTDAIHDEAELQQRVSSKLAGFLGFEIADDPGLVTAIRSLPRDPQAAAEIGQALIQRGFTALDADGRKQFTAMMFREVSRLLAGSPEEVQAGRTLHFELMGKFSKVENPAQKLALLERERDIRLGDARVSKSADDWYLASQAQCDIVALHLQAFGQPLTAQRSAKLDAIAEKAPDLARAMADLDALEREYITQLGGHPDPTADEPGANPEKVRHGWKAGRDKLARMREAASSLEQVTGIEVQAYLSARIRELTADMMARAVEVLGPPPAPMAVVSLGSASRGEASPYSDLEFGILLHEPADQAMQDYTRAFCQFVRFQLNNLGENMGRIAPAGFHWDTGANTPLERPQAFIGTAQQLIAANLGEQAGQRTNEARPQKMFEFTMFSNSELLYAPSGGGAEWQMVRDLQQQANAHFQAPSQAVVGRTRGAALGAWTMREGAEVANLKAKLTRDQVNVKELARLPMMLAQGLALMHGVGLDENDIAANSTAMRLAQLARAGVLSPEDADTLAQTFAVLGEIRIQAHLRAGDADDMVYFDQDKAKGAFCAPILRDVIQTLIPFVEGIEPHIANPNEVF